jgi:hypothetical protein
MFSDEADGLTPKDCGERSARTTNAVLAKAGFKVASGSDDVNSIGV